MKESTLIEKFNRAQSERLQNNQMIQGIMNDLGEMQQFVVGLLATMRKLPGYDDAIQELAAENALKTSEEAKEMEVNSPEEVKPELDLGKECCGKTDCDKC